MLFLSTYFISDAVIGRSVEDLDNCKDLELNNFRRSILKVRTCKQYKSVKMFVYFL